MAQVTTNWGLLRELGALVPYLSTLSIALFVNDYTPVQTSRQVDFQEAGFPGYFRLKLDEWSKPFINRAGKGETDACLKVWTYAGVGGPQQVYGYYVMEPSGAVAWAERAAAPALMAVAGDMYTVFPTRTLTNE